MTTSLERPADSAGELYYPTPVTPEEAFQAIGRLRKEARDEIDRLIQFLDSTDNHMELEDEGDGDDADAEPSLGSFDRMTNQDKAWRTVQGEFIAGTDAEVDNADAEHSLGFLEQPASLYGHGYDRGGNQERLCDGTGGDIELDHAESGIADNDGLQEQMGRQDWTPGVFG